MFSHTHQDVFRYSQGVCVPQVEDHSTRLHDATFPKAEISLWRSQNLRPNSAQWQNDDEVETIWKEAAAA
jgi:hypothetical protein